MAFRADEAIQAGHDKARQYLVARQIPAAMRQESQETLADLVNEHGPVIESYPHWHPLVAAQRDPRSPATTPGEQCGYDGLDHTVCLANGFITCPYGDGQAVMDAVENLPGHPLVAITAEKLEVQFYDPSATPILVSCRWNQGLPHDRTIPKKWAVPLMLEQELPCWTSAELAETWWTMKPYFLGRPHGARSSLFVNQDTGQTMKNIWTALIQTGMFGPIKV